MKTKLNTDFSHVICIKSFSAISIFTSEFGSFLIISEKILESITILPSLITSASTFVSILTSISEPIRVKPSLLASIYIPSNTGIVVFPVIALVTIEIPSCNFCFEHIMFIILPPKLYTVINIELCNIIR